MNTASWLDLPLEIVQQIIIPLCDNESLLSLSKTCHLLNNLALAEFFKRNDVTCPTEGYLVSYLASKDHIPAVHAALWINDLPSIIYHFNPDVERLFFEIRGLTALIGRLPKFKSLELNFSTIDRWFRSRDARDENSENGKPAIPQDVWKEIFCRLLDVAVEKRVGNMRVDGACKLHSYYASAALNDTSQDIPVFEEFHRDLPSEKEKSLLRRTLSRWINILRGIPSLTSPIFSFLSSTKIKSSEHKKNNGPSITTDVIPATSEKHSCIRKLHLSSSMMVQPLFRPYTINLLRNHSETLRYVNFTGLRASHSVWTEIFDNMHLPQLKTFIYEYDTLVVSNTILDHHILIPFFIRHPTITMLELYGVALPKEFPILQQAILPNLKILDAHPRIVSYILSNPTYCPVLESISLSSEYYALYGIHPEEDRLDPYKDFNKALLTIASLRRPINLLLKFSTEIRLLDWLSEHTNNTDVSNDNDSNININVNIIQQLTNVEHLTISCHFHTHFLDEHKAILPKFLALFPSLKYLRLMDMPYQEEIMEETFLKSVNKAVPGLVSFIVGRNVIVGERSAIVDLDVHTIAGEVW